MAFREIRIHFSSYDSDIARELNLSVGGPFEWYMDGVMRGRFKEYSGEEVKGIKLVNFCCYSPEHVKMMESNSGRQLPSIWSNLLNTYQYEVELDLRVFSGTQKENIHKAIELFIKYASLLDVPAMQALVQHTKESIGINSIDQAVKRNAQEIEREAKKMVEVQRFLSKRI